MAALHTGDWFNVNPSFPPTFLFIYFFLQRFFFVEVVFRFAAGDG